MLVCTWVAGKWKNSEQIKAFDLYLAFSSPLAHLAMRIPSLLGGTSAGALTDWSVTWKGTWTGLYGGDAQ